MSMAAVPFLSCTLISGEANVDDEDRKNETKITCRFRQEDGKKSSFLLETKNSETLEIQPPSHLIVEIGNLEGHHHHQPFFLGGFQIVSNSKQCEVHLTPHSTTNKEAKEDYLMTSKAVPFEKEKHGEDWYKAICVIPGGPRPITRLRLKLISLKNSGEKESSCGRVMSMKLTARLPEITTDARDENRQPLSKTIASSQPDGVNASTTTVPNFGKGIPNMPTSSGITKDDLGALMASLSFLAMSTEKNIERTINDKFVEMETDLSSRWSIMEQHLVALTSVVVSQKSDLEEKNKLLEQQQEIIQTLAEQSSLLLQQQQQLATVVETLQTHLTDIRTTFETQEVERGAVCIGSAEEEKKQEANSFSFDSSESQGSFGVHGQSMSEETHSEGIEQTLHGDVTNGKVTSLPIDLLTTKQQDGNTGPNLAVYLASVPEDITLDVEFGIEHSLEESHEEVHTPDHSQETPFVSKPQRKLSESRPLEADDDDDDNDTDAITGIEQTLENDDDLSNQVDDDPLDVSVDHSESEHIKPLPTSKAYFPPEMDGNFDNEVDPMAGIEQTLENSNEEMDQCDEGLENNDEVIPVHQRHVPQDNHPIGKGQLLAGKTYGLPKGSTMIPSRKKVDFCDTNPCVPTEKIEVSLLDDAAYIEEHGSSQESSAMQTPRSTNHSSEATGDDPGVPKLARSFEERNDKHELNEEIPTGKIEIELKAGNENFRVKDDLNNDEDERYPPEVAEGDLLGL